VQSRSISCDLRHQQIVARAHNHDFIHWQPESECDLAAGGADAVEQRPGRRRRKLELDAALAAQRGDELSGAGPEAEEGRLAPSGRREEGVRCGEGRVPAEVHLDRRREPPQLKRLATGGLALEALHLARARRPHEGGLGQVLVRGDRAHPGGVGRRVEQADGGGVAGKGDPRKRVDVQQRRTALVRHH